MAPTKKSIANKRRKQFGLPPGSIVFTGSQKVESVYIHHITYSESEFSDIIYSNQEEIILKPSDKSEINWYDIRGLHDIELIESIGQIFDIHNLILEDIVDIHQRPKFEEYELGNFIVIRALHYHKEKKEIWTEQVGLYFNNGLLLTFQETDSDLFNVVRTRINSSKGRIRKKGADYLAYTIMDTIVDSYYFILDELESEIEQLEKRILENPDESIKADIHGRKQELLSVRKTIGPLREAISRFSKSDSEFIDEKSEIYIRDLYDHTVQIMDLVETYRDMLTGLQDLYISEISFKMNQVMQVLAVVTTVFVPLSFLAGLYGMNFVNIPELQNKNGYFILIGVMVLIATGSLLFFKKKKWF